jgi:hypothetical protein
MLIQSILRVALQVLAGVGLTKFADRWIKPKVPATIYPTEILPGTNYLKIGLLVVFFVMAVLLTKFVGKKLNVKLLK